MSESTFFVLLSNATTTRRTQSTKKFLLRAGIHTQGTQHQEQHQPSNGRSSRSGCPSNIQPPSTSCCCRFHPSEIWHGCHASVMEVARYITTMISVMMTLLASSSGTCLLDHKWQIRHRSENGQKMVRKRSENVRPVQNLCSFYTPTT